MDKNIVNQLDAELAHAGEETSLSPARLLLEQQRITPDRQLPSMDFLFSLYGKPCLPRRELVAIAGKAKSGKTLVTSMLMAKALATAEQPQADAGYSLSARLPPLSRTRDEPLHVLWYDTEQSDESTQDILKSRILRMLPSQEKAGGGLDVFNVRAVEWSQRRALLTEAVRMCRPDLVIVDGIRDLVNDINDGVLAQEVMEELLHLSADMECCIVCVLHQNKSGEDRNLRGWIGTELMNKAFEVYSCEKLMPERIFKLEQTLTRKYDIDQTLYFEVGSDSLPSVSALPSGEAIPTATPAKEPLPQLNQKYILHGDGDTWKFDTMRLFLDALRDDDEVQGKEMRERVMKLGNIIHVRKYNQLLQEALEQKAIEKTTRNGLTFYRAAPF